MGLSVNFKLLEIQANKLTEKEDDEIYIVTTAQFFGSDNKIVERAPGGKEFWKIRLHETLDFDFDLMLLHLTNGLRLKVKVMEEDVSGMLGKIPGVNDFIGEFTLTVNADGQVECACGKDTARITATEEPRYKFVMQGSGAEYVTEFQLTII